MLRYLGSHTSRYYSRPATGKRILVRLQISHSCGVTLQPIRLSFQTVQSPDHGILHSQLPHPQPYHCHYTISIPALLPVYSHPCSSDTAVELGE